MRAEIKNGFPGLRHCANPARPNEKELLEPLEIVLTDGKDYTIEAGFVTDLASVPRSAIKISIMITYSLALVCAEKALPVLTIVFFALATAQMTGFSFCERALRDEAAFIIHDWLYENRKRFNYSREFVDCQMREFMFELGASRWRVFFMFWAVRLFGWIFWNNDERNQ